VGGFSTVHFPCARLLFLVQFTIPSFNFAALWLPGIGVGVIAIADAPPLIHALPL
jgi:hypothetical protein